MELNVLQKDAIVELFNIGMGKAAASLSEMVGEEVVLSVPDVFTVTRAAATDRLGLSEEAQVSVVREGFSGPFWGDALLLFPQADSLDLVHALLQEELPLEMLSEMEQEALTEVGNIILNACLGSLANIFTQDLHYQMPEFSHGDCASVLNGDEGKEQDLVLILRMDFKLQRAAVDGYLTLIMDIDSVHAFIEHVDRFIQGVV